MGTKIINEITKELEASVEKKYREESPKYHKESVKYLGVRTPIVRKIAKKYFKQLKNLNQEKIFLLSEQLLKSKFNEEATIAIQWISELNLKETDFKKITYLFSAYITNWGSCDDFCLRILSHFIVKFPKHKNTIKSWTSSKNKWQRRASAVAFIQGGSWTISPKYITDVFEVALKLMYDTEDLVQKGCGWMLKVTADTHQKQVFNFVMNHKTEMKRVTLRYAIEKMPKPMKKKAMKK